MTEKLRKNIEKISNLKAFQIYESKRKLFGYNFLIGIARGLGTVFGATIVFTLVILILSKLELVPFFGNFVSDILVYLGVPLER